MRAIRASRRCVGSMAVIAFAWCGHASGQTVIFQANGANAGDRFGFSVANVGDLNGDGVQDFYVGAPYASPGGLNGSGQTKVVSGVSGLAIANHTFNGQQLLDGFGISGAAVGDVDLDGVPDYAIGIPFKNAPGGGSVWVISGATGAILNGTSGISGGAGAQYGMSIASIGDINGDGRPEIAIGAPGYTAPVTPAKPQQGWVGILSILGSGSSTFLFSAVGANAGDNLGLSVAGIGDVTGDGRPDFAVGGGQTSTGPGFVQVYRNNTPAFPAFVSLYTLTGPAAGALFGTAIKSVGDLDADARPDFVVGARSASPGGIAAAGSATLFSGATGATIQSFNGSAAQDRFGGALAALGDVDTDGVADFAVGAIQSNDFGTATGPGFVRLISGKTLTTAMTISGSNFGDLFGCSLDSAGDLNGDGFADLLVGANKADPGGLTDAGQVRAYSLVPTGLSFFGAGTSGCAGAERLSAKSSCKINTSWTVTCNKAPPSSLGLFMLTGQKLVPPGDPFGIGATILVDLNFTLLLPDMNSNAAGFGATAPIPIPNDPTLVGQTIFGQALWIWPSGTCSLPPVGASTSSGLQATIQ